MNRNARLLASALSVTLLTSAIVYLVFGDKARDETIESAPKKVLVFSEDFEAGHTLTAQDFRWVNASTTAGPAGDFLQREDEKLSAIGARLAQKVVAGELVLKNSYIPKVAKVILSERLNPGFRAVTISTDMAQLAAGRLLPGDHVDVLVAPSSSPQGGPLSLPGLSAPTTTETSVTRLYENVRVLAISGATEPEDPSDGKMDSSLLKDATITLELRPDQAERVLAASTLGKIMLPLRRPFDPVGELSAAPRSGPRLRLRLAQPTVPMPSPTPPSDPALSATPAAPQSVIIIRGTN